MATLNKLKIYFNNSTKDIKAFPSLFTDGQSSVEVQLITKKYVEKESSATLYCRHNVGLDILYKVPLSTSNIHQFRVISQDVESLVYRKSLAHRTINANFH